MQFPEDTTMKSQKTDTPGVMYNQRGKISIVDTEKPNRILVAGDIHGDLRAFKRILSLMQARDLAIFLGDYADRGPYGLEVIEGLMAASRRLHGRILTLKGNHEDFTPKGEPRFQPCTLIEKISQKGRKWEELFPVLSGFFDTMSCAALIPGFALLVHGGIVKEIESPATLERPSRSIEEDIIWSDPGAFPGQHSNPRGAGRRFGPGVTEKVLHTFGVRYLIRSHEPRKAANGPFFEHNGKVITTSATSIYGGRPFVLLLTMNNLPRSRKAFLNCVEYLD